MNCYFYTVLVSMTCLQNEAALCQNIRKIPEKQSGVIQADFSQNFHLKGEIYGTVKDINGNGLPYARLTIIEDFEGVKTTKMGSKCNERGEFQIRGLEPGKYNILCQALGKEKEIVTRIEVTHEKKTELHIQLKNLERTISCSICRCDMRKSKSAIEKAQIEKKEEILQYYPNPNYGYLTVEPPLNSYLVEIYDIKGQQIYSNDLRENDKKIEIDLNPYPNGIYFLICSASGEKKFYEKIELNR